MKRVENSLNPPQHELLDLKTKYNASKTKHKRLLRYQNVQESIERDKMLDSIRSGNPSALYKSIKRNKNGKTNEIQKLTVRDRLYLGDDVPDGFYDSLSHLKTIDRSTIQESQSYNNFLDEYEHIIEICNNGEKIPMISAAKSSEILHKIKPQVNDLYSITASHYINAGAAGITHFHLLLSELIKDVSNITITEINTVHANILFKGHDKEKTSDRSYRTISVCPLVAKAMDLYVRELQLPAWNADQSDVQFLGEGSSHELAALLLTETVQSSLFSAKQPLFALFLDAKSAFDVVLRKLLVRNLYHSGTSGHSLLLINNRLKSRTTFIEWNKQLMGPIKDELGVEQGGANSGDYYKIFGKEQLTMAQSSCLGVPLGTDTISAIGDADDTVLISNCLHSLQNLLQLTLIFCSKYQVHLCIEKTKLIAISTPAMALTVNIMKTTSPLRINGTRIPFVDTAEHLGILRNKSSNLPNILKRISAHKNALGAVLHAGLARGHRGNPAASLKVESLHGIPVLLSGLGALVLLKSEIEMLDHHLKETHERMMRLHARTPQCVVAFLAGCLPGTAKLHQRMLSIFGMVSRLPRSILHQHARRVLVASKPSAKSWFTEIRNLCLLYSLPHPLSLLETPMTKDNYKKLVKQQITNFWEIKLRNEASSLSSLEFFHPNFMSLRSPHPIWTTAGSSSYQVAMSTVQGLMISGRYRTEQLCRHWSANKKGFCLAPSCIGLELVEDLPHILIQCASLEPTRQQLLSFTVNYSQSCEILQPILRILYLRTHSSFCQFLIDCSVLPTVIAATQQYGPDVLHHLFRITRTWCFCLHKARLKILGRWCSN